MLGLSDEELIRRCKVELPLQRIKKLRLRSFPYAHCPVTLHVRVTPQRADPRARLPEVPSQQQQVRYLLNGGGAADVLGDSHAITDNGRFRARIRASDGFERFAAQAGARIAGKQRSGSDMATDRLPPRQTSAFARPSMIACIARTAS